VNFCEGQAECKVVVLKPDFNGKGLINSFKFYDIGSFIEAGERAATGALPQIRRMMESHEK
jgi:hypothetical protein